MGGSLALQSFENSLSDLEPLNSLKRKIQQKNTEMRDISRQLGEIRAKQVEIRDEREQYDDAMRLGLFTSTVQKRCLTRA